MDSTKRRPGACICGKTHARVGQSEEGEVIMHRHEDDGLDVLGCVAIIAVAAVFLVLLLVFIGV
jgi:hypothetical protein